MKGNEEERKRERSRLERDTYIHVYSIDVVGLVRWILIWCISIELHSLEHPLYLVQWQPFQIVMAGERHRVAGSHHRWHVDCQVLQSRHTCERIIRNDFTNLLVLNSPAYAYEIISVTVSAARFEGRRIFISIRTVIREKFARISAR